MLDFLRCALFGANSEPSIPSQVDQEDGALMAHFNAHRTLSFEDFIAHRNQIGYVQYMLSRPHFEEGK